MLKVVGLESHAGVGQDDVAASAYTTLMFRTGSSAGLLGGGSARDCLGRTRPAPEARRRGRPEFRSMLQPSGGFRQLDESRVAWRRNAVFRTAGST